MAPCCCDGRARAAATAASCYNFQISQFVVTCVDVSVCACQRTKGWCISPCVSCCTQVCVCVRARLRSLVRLRVQPIFPWPRLEQQTDMQRPAPRCTEIFLDCCVTERQAVGGTSFSKPNDFLFFPGLVVWMMNFLFIAYEYKTTRLWLYTCREADSRSKYSLEVKEETWSRC